MRRNGIQRLLARRSLVSACLAGLWTNFAFFAFVSVLAAGGDGDGDE